jgi:hypothetical protein
VLEFDIDDMTGEEIALAADRLVRAAALRLAGSRAGKKGRLTRTTGARASRRG